MTFPSFFVIIFLGIKRIVVNMDNTNNVNNGVGSENNAPVNNGVSVPNTQPEVINSNTQQVVGQTSVLEGVQTNTPQTAQPVQSVQPQTVAAPTVQPTPETPMPEMPAMPEVAPMEAAPMEEQVISTHKKKTSNLIMYILVIILILFVVFIDPIKEFITDKIIDFKSNNPNTSENLISGFLKLEEKSGYIKVNNIKYYNVKKSNETNIILNYEPYKNSSNIEKEGIYIELYNADKEILSKTLFNPSKIEKEVVRTFTFEVTNDVYTDAFYALVKTYTDEELKSTKTLTCKYTVNNDNITLNYVNTYEFINNSLTKYNVNKTFSYKEDNTESNKYKGELKSEYLNINDFNIKSEYNDTSLKYSIDLSNEIKDFRPLYKKDTIITIVKNKEELKKWKCE